MRPFKERPVTTMRSVRAETDAARVIRTLVRFSIMREKYAIRRFKDIEVLGCMDKLATFTPSSGTNVDLLPCKVLWNRSATTAPSSLYCLPCVSTTQKTASKYDGSLSWLAEAEAIHGAGT